MSDVQGNRRAGEESLKIQAFATRPPSAPRTIGPGKLLSVGDGLGSRSGMGGWAPPIVAPQRTGPASEAALYDAARRAEQMAIRAQKSQKPERMAQDLAELGRTLQDAGRSLVKLATKTVSAAADDAIGTADDALAVARGRLKKIRTQIRRARPRTA
ncbi:hypothetical protein [Anaeromyxobacter oryzisoli]|uniref:hypothetical protein n=1 Tax=Anaeromyxobacter oryzisoli TaxID=2925408 RepID=UPI001F5893F7|nr:hypothetical protein [Anaeromyxobacter sp. SG63]